MAGFSNTIRTTIDVVSDKASASVKSFRQSIQEAEGASGKLKASFGAAGSFIQANAAAVAATAGTALVGFAIKSVGAFQDLAIEAGRMGDQLAIGSEAASRWIEIAGDYGLSADTITSAMSRMEKTAGQTPAVFEQLGVAIAKAKDGTVDANETFLNVIERLRAIKDPTERAAVGAKLLGKNWGELAELLNGDVRKALKSVSDAKIIDQDEVEKARRFRAAMDSLQDSLQEVSLVVGEMLVPALADGAEKLSDWQPWLERTAKALGVTADAAIGLDNISSGLGRAWDGNNSILERGTGILEGFAGAIPGVGEGVSRLTDLIFDEGDALDEGSEAVGRFTAWLTKASDAAEVQSEQQADLTGVTELLSGAIEEARNQLEAWYDAVNGSIDADAAYKQSLNDVEDATIDLFGKVQDLNRAQGSDRAAAIEAVSRSEDDLLAAYLDQSRAAVELWAKNVELAGGQLSGADAARIQRDELLKLRDSTQPGSSLYNALTGYIEKLESVPEEVKTTAKLDTTQASRQIDDLKRRLQELNAAGKAPRSGAAAGSGSGGTTTFSPITVDGGGRTSGMLHGLAATAAGGGKASTLLASDLLRAVEQLTSAQSSFADGNATAAEVISEYNSQLTDANPSTERQTELQKKGMQAALAAARAKGQQAQAEAALEGRTLSAIDVAKVQTTELSRLANTVAEGSPLLEGMRSYIRLLAQVQAGSEETVDTSKDQAKAALEQADADLQAARARQTVTDATNDYVSALFMAAKTREEAAQKADAIARAEQGMIDAILRESSALAEQQRIAAAARGVTLSDAEIANLRIAAISAQTSQLQGGNVRSTLDAYAATLANAINITVNAGLGVNGALVARELFDELDRESRRRGLGGL